MSYQRFNRHELFDRDLMNYHSDTIRLVEDWCLEHGKDLYNTVTNQLCGIWDGYLYDTLLTDAKALGLPIEDVRRIEDTITVITEYIDKTNKQ